MSGVTVSYVLRNGTVVLMKMENANPEIRVPVMAIMSAFDWVAANPDKQPQYEVDRYRLGHVGPHEVHYYYRIQEAR